MPATLEEILNSHRTRRPIIAGILNVTPDSFSDGGKFLDPSAAVAQGRTMIAQGADIIDIGAESTRPGAQRIGAAEQISRLRDVLTALADCPAVLSVDTTLAEVAGFAIDLGVRIINDISAGRGDPNLLPLVARSGCAAILMHMLGQPADMQKAPQYNDVVAEVHQFLAQRLEAAAQAGIDPGNVILDPGIGFGKRIEHNLALLAEVDKLAELGRPIMIGASRKRFIGELTGQDDPARRISGTVAACLASWHGGATIFRVHDVGEVASAMAVARAIQKAGRRK